MNFFSVSVLKGCGRQLDVVPSAQEQNDGESLALCSIFLNSIFITKWRSPHFERGEAFFRGKINGSLNHFFIFNFSKFSIHFWNSHFCTTLCQKGSSIFFLAGVRHWPQVRSITDCSRPSDALYFMMGALQGEWRGSRNRDGHRSENGTSRSIGKHPLIPIDSPPFVPCFRVCRFKKMSQKRIFAFLSYGDDSIFFTTGDAPCAPCVPNRFSRKNQKYQGWKYRFFFEQTMYRGFYSWAGGAFIFLLDNIIPQNEISCCLFIWPVPGSLLTIKWLN